MAKMSKTKEFLFWLSIGLMAYGAYLIYPPLMFIFLGMTLLFLLFCHAFIKATEAKSESDAKNVTPIKSKDAA